MGVSGSAAAYSYAQYVYISVSGCGAEDSRHVRYMYVLFEHRVLFLISPLPVSRRLGGWEAALHMVPALYVKGFMRRVLRVTLLILY